MNKRGVPAGLDQELGMMVAAEARRELEASIDYWATHSCFAYQPVEAKEAYRQWARANVEYLRTTLSWSDETDLGDAALARRFYQGGFVEERYLQWLKDTGVLRPASPRDYLRFLAGYVQHGGEVRVRTEGSAENYEVYRLTHNVDLLPLVLYARKTVQILVPANRIIHLPYGRGDANIFRMNHYGCEGNAEVYPDTYTLGVSAGSSSMGLAV